MLRQVAPAAGMKLPVAFAGRVKQRITSEEKVAAICDIQARILGSIDDEVIGEATLQQRSTAFAILEDKLGVIEARPPAPLRAADRLRAMELLGRLAERERREAGAVEAKAAEVRG